MRCEQLWCERVVEDSRCCFLSVEQRLGFTEHINITIWLFGVDAQLRRYLGIFYNPEMQIQKGFNLVLVQQSKFFLFVHRVLLGEASRYIADNMDVIISSWFYEQLLLHS